VYNHHLLTCVTLTALLTLLRSVSYNLTLLPPCSTMPEKPHYETESCSRILLRYLLHKDTHFGYYNDLLFSGHTSFVVMFCLHVSYFHLAPIWLLSCFWCVAVGTSFVIICSRCHYTIDVVYAWVVTMFVFQHTVAPIDSILY